MGRFDQSEKYLRRATELDPTSAQAWLNLGVVLDTRGKPQDAESAYRRALELDSRNISTLQNLAQNLIGQQRGTEAIVLMEQVVSRSDSPSIRKEYGDAFAAAKQWSHAVAQYDLALKSNPGYVPAINAKGFALIQDYVEGLELNEKERTTALDLWRSSLKIYPNQPQVADAIRKWENPKLFAK
jgi:Flp pilus assembly protein TadD